MLYSLLENSRNDHQKLPFILPSLGHFNVHKHFDAIFVTAQLISSRSPWISTKARRPEPQESSSAWMSIQTEGSLGRWYLQGDLY